LVADAVHPNHNRIVERQRKQAGDSATRPMAGIISPLCTALITHRQKNHHAVLRDNRNLETNQIDAGSNQKDDTGASPMNTANTRPTHSSENVSRPDGARGVRVVALVMGAAFLMLVLAFVMMVFFVHDEARLNAVGPIASSPGAERGGLVFTGTANIWEVRGRMTLNDDRQVRFDVEFVGPTAQPAPDSLDVRFALDMPEHDMEALRPPLRRAGPGGYVATAALPHPGQWRLRIELPEITGVFLFEVEH
jgi:hypothetical protein